MIYLTFSIHHFVPCESYSAGELHESAFDSLDGCECHQQEYHKLTKVSKETAPSPATLPTVPSNNIEKSVQFISHTSETFKCPLVSSCKNGSSCHPLSLERQMIPPVQKDHSTDQMSLHSMWYLCANFLAFTLLKVFNLKSTWSSHHSQTQMFWRKLCIGPGKVRAALATPDDDDESTCFSLWLSNLRSSWKLKSKQFIRWYLTWTSSVSLS